MISGILATKRQEVEELGKVPAGGRKKPIIPLVLAGRRNIIAELKRKSPSAGFIGEIDRQRIIAYSRHASAISVLTDRTYFGGSLEFLREVADQTDLPVLCKDFIIDPRQIDHAHAAGADLVLLIARILGRDRLESLYRHAATLGLACLVELHDGDDLATLGTLDAPILGVNARDLDTLRIDLDAAARLLSRIPSPVRVAESGIRSGKDMERLRDANAFLIGETLMRSADVEGTFKELLYGADQVLRDDEPR
ncbi:MAG: indole-3-glycerol-phosphate synthase [Syntrophorhabdales bacterium]|jgi:indole-3-glycerol phosphate synthase